ncbi:type VII secretion protein EccCb [Cumulibacter soli]|uniref:type VII secretion protein EccCb n=1 Tax=Cumulibacter soli TaxID=2546344 RepID=UPI00106816A6|nr:type VII secretion protein EccCb [Cumulibacter soli]
MRAGENLVAVDNRFLNLPEVPDLPSRGSNPWWMSALPAVGSLGAVGFLALAPRSPFIYIAGGLIVAVSIAMVAGNYARNRRDKREGKAVIRDRFLAELNHTRAAMRADDALLRASKATATISGSTLHVPMATDTLDRDESTILTGERPDPFCHLRLEQFVARTRAVRDIPVRYPLAAATVISGAAQDTRGFARQVARRLVLDFEPHEVRIAVLTAHPHRWTQLRWAPQHRHPVLVDDVGAARLVADSSAAMADLLTSIEEPVLLIADTPSLLSDALIRQARWCLILQPAGHEADVAIEARSLRHRDMPRALPSIPCSAAELEAACRSAAAREHPARAMHSDTSDEVLRPLLGWGPDGPVHLDIRESSTGGSGPHGMLIGVTGSGKSEVLRTIVAGLLTVHTPGELALLLIDFKGGATFEPFTDLSQTAGVVTNLEDDPALVDRVLMALSAELRRRQRLLRTAGVAGIDDLPAAMSTPRLLVVVDEFSELLAAHADAIDVLVQIGRLGRSLGVHLLIASQRLDEGRLKGLEAHLTYRIALRTQSVAESRSILGTADAATLPNTPGHGFLRCGSADPTAFKARYTGDPHVTPTRAHRDTQLQPKPLTYRNGRLCAAAHTASGPTILQHVIATAAATPGVRLPIWAPPPHLPHHRDLYPDLQVRADRGFGTVRDPAMCAAIGTVDRPDLQRTEIGTVNLSSGHLAIVGTTRSGSTTLAQAALLSLALRHTPDELNLYLIEAAPAAFANLKALPHVAECSSDTQRAAAVIRRIEAIVSQREQGAHSTAAVLLAIDGYARFRDRHDALEAIVLDIARRGLSVGVYLVVTTHRWLDLPARLRELFGNRIEMRLGDPIESEIDRRSAALVPRGQPGRGLTQDGHALYGAGGDPTQIVDQIVRHWRGSRARGLPQLPTVLTTGNLSTDVTDRGLCVAVDRSSARPILLSESAPYTLIIGDGGSGRTSILRSLGRQHCRRGAKVLVIDPRRRLLDAFEPQYQLGYAATPSAAAELIDGLVTGLERRMPPADITADALREQTWWSGPQLHLLVDDYDLATMVGTNLAPLRRFLPYAADIGLRVTVARRASGAVAGMHDEVLSVLRDLGACGLLLSRANDEGPLLGARPGPAGWGTGVFVGQGRGTVDIQAIVETV